MNLKKTLYSITTGSAVILALLLILFYRMLMQPWTLEQNHVFVVEQGSSFYSVINKLDDFGSVSYPRLVRLYASYTGLDNIRAGEFLLINGMNLADILHLLNSDSVIRYNVTLVEGNTFNDFLTTIQSQPKIRQVIKDWTPEQVLAAIEAADSHPEGLFAPETYSYTAGETDLSILKRAYNRQQKILQSAWAQRDQNIPLKTPYEVLILASIVEKETGVAYERPAIAGVFTRRLQQGMRLQSDPTTIYGLGDRYEGNLRSAHLQERNAYNTYRISGLPVTPIANPGKDAIIAATQPEEGSALYFVAKGDGSHQFSNTLTEHNLAVRKYQIYQRSRNYQSAPEGQTP